MKVRANASMKALIGADTDAPERISLPCPPALIVDLVHGFKEVDGCVVPTPFESGSISSAERVRNDNQDDETGFECGLSKVHIEDYVGNALPLADTIRYGIAYAMSLRQAVCQSIATGNFRIIVDGQLPDADPDVGGSICTVRFHKLRAGQAWLKDDLDSYRLNAVMAIDFDATECWLLVDGV